MMKIMTPGTTDACGAVMSSLRPSPSMEPRSACGGCDPRPRKERPAVSRIIQPMVVDIAITMTGMTFGRISDPMMRKELMPVSRAASTNSRWAIATVAPRMLRAKKGMLTTATA